MIQQISLEEKPLSVQRFGTSQELQRRRMDGQGVNEVVKYTGMIQPYCHSWQLHALPHGRHFPKCVTRVQVELVHKHSSIQCPQLGAHNHFHLLTRLWFVTLYLLLCNHQHFLSSVIIYLSIYLERWLAQTFFKL